MKTRFNILLILLALFTMVRCSSEEELNIENLNSDGDKVRSSSFRNSNLRLSAHQFKGFNWADARDNFVDGWVIPSGLTASDSYSTVQSKANTILSGFQNAGANMVRLPINPSSVNSSWWSAYKGAIDQATSMGMSVILAYWEAESSRDGLVDDTNEFWSMWDTVVSDYTGNGSVYFEVFNEPHGYSTSQLVSLYDSWLSNYPNVPRGRIVLGGTGYSENVSNIGGYSQFSDCLLSQHLYAWWGNYTSTAQWESALNNAIGSYTDRTIITEFGAPMTTGKNYTGAINGDAEIAFIQGLTNYCYINGVSSIYWPGLRDGDTYSMYTYNGSMNLTNSSGLSRLQYGWGQTSSGTWDPNAYYRLINRNSGQALDVNSASTSNGANIIQWPWNGGNNQQWQIIDNGNGYYRLINRNSGLALDVNGGSTTNGESIIQWPWNGGANQEWEIIDNGGGYYRVINRNSGQALDVNGASATNGADVIQWPWNGGNNQQWEIIQQ